MSIIKNAGWMWHRKYVDWSKAKSFVGHPESRYGGLSDENFTNGICFADQAAIYALYDANHNCVYIGQAGKGEQKGLFDRLKDHTNDYLFCMWERFSWFGFYPISNILNDEYKDFEIRTDINQILDLSDRTFRVKSLQSA